MLLTNELLTQWVAEGMTVRQICHKSRYSADQVYRRVNALGLRPKKKPRGPLKNVERVRRLLAQLGTYEAVAKRLGVTKQAVWYRLHLAPGAPLPRSKAEGHETPTG